MTIQAAEPAVVANVGMEANVSDIRTIKHSRPIKGHISAPMLTRADFSTDRCWSLFNVYVQCIMGWLFWDTLNVEKQH